MTGQVIPIIRRGRRGRTEIDLPYPNRQRTFIHPAAGPGTYREVGRTILENNLGVPSGDDTTILVYPAYCIPGVKDEPEFINVRRIMEDQYFWIFNRNGWAKKGVYVLKDPQALGNSEPLDQESLDKMLEGGTELIHGVILSKDKNLAFAEKGTYTFGEHTSKSLAKDGFVIATNFGLEGAEQMAEVASTFKNDPYTYGIESDKLVQTVSALGSDYLGYWLSVGGYRNERSRYGRAFGVSKSGEARAKK